MNMNLPPKYAALLRQEYAKQQGAPPMPLVAPTMQYPTTPYTHLTTDQSGTIIEHAEGLPYNDAMHIHVGKVADSLKNPTEPPTSHSLHRQNPDGSLSAIAISHMHPQAAAAPQGRTLPDLNLASVDQAQPLPVHPLLALTNLQMHLEHPVPMEPQIPNPAAVPGTQPRPRPDTEISPKMPAQVAHE